MNLIVIAKEPVAGRSKTRLSPPLAPADAARVALAALTDTLRAVSIAAGTLGARPVLALDGRAGPWLPEGFAVIAQRGRDLAERLAAAFDDAGGTSLLIGMDTPQVTPDVILDAATRLARPGVDAVLGAAVDGGWWALGLRRPDRRVFLGIPMSTPITCVAQRARLRELELVTHELDVMRDVDTFDDALAVAPSAPATRFAEVVAELHQPARVEDA